MKVLHISSSDSMGGAAQSAYRLHRALIGAGVDSVFFAAEKRRADDPTVISFTNGGVKRRVLAVIDALLLYFYRNRTRKYPFTNNWFPFTGLAKVVRRVKPDVVHLHWIGKGVLRLEDMRRFRLPVIWTMHDNYAFTGGCHLVNDCVKYKSICGSCPQLASRRQADRSTVNFHRKEALYPPLKVTFLAPSSWMMNIARESALLRSAAIIRVPNLIETGSFFPGKKAEARKSLGIGMDTKVILFGAMDALTDPNKGFGPLLQAINGLPYNNGVHLLVFGAEKPENMIPLKYGCTFTGYVSELRARRNLYVAADVLVVPSRVENLSNVIMEAMSCGTPVVAFNSGGNGDLVDHGVNGYLATAWETEDLRNGICWVLDHPDPAQVSRDAAEKIRTTFDSSVVAQQHLLVYRDIVQ